MTMKTDIEDFRLHILTIEVRTDICKFCTVRRDIKMDSGY